MQLDLHHSYYKSVFLHFTKSISISATFVLHTVAEKISSSTFTRLLANNYILLSLKKSVLLLFICVVWSKNIFNMLKNEYTDASKTSSVI